MRTIRPLKDNLIVKQDPPKEQLKSGLFVPQSSLQYTEDTGTVIAVGPGRITKGGLRAEMSVKPGDRVAFKRRPASHLGDTDPEWQDHLLLKDEDIIGVIEDADHQDAISSGPQCECH